MIGLRREVTEQDGAQLEYVMPLIQNGLNKATKALSDCIVVKDTVTSWYGFCLTVHYFGTLRIQSDN